METQMETQEAAGAAQSESFQTSELEIRAMHVEETQADPLEKNAREAEVHETAGADAEDAHALDEPDGDAIEANKAEPFDVQVNEIVIEEDETQLAAIRELMTRAGARGVWLTLGEIADATQFAEASISAQLRHLRKPRHGGHRVEKRCRGRRRTAAARTVRDGRRGPVIWEYCVLAGR